MKLPVMNEPRIRAATLPAIKKEDRFVFLL